MNKTDKEIRYDNFYMDVAVRTAEMSYARRKKVGCVIVKDGNIISLGWNGMPSGMDNNCEVEGDGVLHTRYEVSHAEENALSKLAKRGGGADGSTVYNTYEPCLQCAKLMYSCGVKSRY